MTMEAYEPKPHSREGRKQARRLAAEERQAARDARTDEEQLKSLERRGHGHCKEAQRLRERLAK